MHFLIKITSAVALAVAMAGAAQAAPRMHAPTAAKSSSEHIAAGRLQHVNPAKNRLVLNNRAYRYNPGKFAWTPKAGQMVRVQYHHVGGQRAVDQIWAGRA